MHIFTNDLEGLFIKRPNRFIVYVDTPLGEIRAHCPNPGRLTEILTPGCKLILEKGEERRKTPYSLVAAYYKNKVIPLYSGRANHVAKEVILPQIFPEALAIKPEVTYGKSRFDFLVTLPNKKIFVEVKACTLVEEGIAMFPDAPSERASRHLMELMDLPDGYEGHVFFVINHEDARGFRPNLHTDSHFAQTMKEAKEKITFHGVSIKTTSQGLLDIVNPKVPILFDNWEEIDDQGIYLMIYQIAEGGKIVPGSFGPVYLKKGFYVYVGSAKKNLMQRVKRHKGKRKNMHWHVDYLRPKASKVIDLPIFTLKDLECELARDLMKIFQSHIPDFGCTDCTCHSHLFFYENNPLNNQAFLDLLFHYRHTKAFS